MKLVETAQILAEYFTVKEPDVTRKGTIRTIYVSPASAAPMQSVTSAKLIPGVGIEGDRYATGQGTYSGRFMAELGRNLTLISYDSIQERMKEHGTKFTMDKLRRNVFVEGLTSQDINDMVGREIQIGSSCRLSVHRRNVPCKYREATTQCPQFMNTFWEDCGVCCEILEVGASIKIGDVVRFLPNTFQPNRCNVGLKPPGFFTKPSERSLSVVKASIIPVHIAVGLALWDPVGFVRVEQGYQSVGQHFWSPSANKAGIFVTKYVRTPLFLALGVGVVAYAMGIINDTTVRF